MGASEQLTEAVTVSGGGVTLRKEFVEDEYTVPTIRFVVDNGGDDDATVQITEAVPEEYSVDAVGFHPEYGAEHWTCYDDERCEFERDVGAGEEYETVYGIKIDDVEEVDAFMTEPRLVVDGEDVTDGDGDREVSDTEVDKEILDGGATAAAEGTVGDAADGDGSDDAGDATATEGENTAVTPDSAEDERPAASLDVEIPDEVQDNGDGEALEVDLAAPDEEAVAEAAAVSGPETGSVIAHLVAELQRNDVDADQKAVLREQLDLGVPSETKARIDQLSNRVETVAAYADALEDFLDEEGTAQELIDDFETQVEALRGDVASIREQTGSNASEIGNLGDDLDSLATQVEDLEGTLDDVAEQADDVEDSLSTTDSQLATVEGDLRQAEDRIEDNATEIGELDADLGDVEGDLSDVEARVADSEDDIETLDEAAADLRNDVDDVEEDVEELEETTEDNAEAIDSVEEYAEELDEDIGSVADDVEDVEDDVEEVENDVEDILEWRDELGEMFQ